MLAKIVGKYGALDYFAAVNQGKGLWLISLVVLCITGSLSGCQSEAESEISHVDVVLVTEYGEIAIDLFDETPRHRDNFLKLARAGFFDSLAFHRVIHEFMIQVGDPRTRAAYPAVDTAADDGPGYTLPAEIGSHSVNVPGRLGAARLPDEKNPEKRSAGSQFYIVAEGEPVTSRVLDSMANVRSGQMRGKIYEAYRAALADSSYIGSFDEYLAGEDFEPFAYAPSARQAYREQGGAIWLDFNYTVFGEVVSGMPVVNRINQTATDQYDRPREAIRILEARVLADDK